MMLTARTMLSLIVAAGLGLGGLAAANGEIRARVQAKTRGMAKTAAQVGAQIRAEVQQELAQVGLSAEVSGRQAIRSSQRSNIEAGAETGGEVQLGFSGDDNAGAAVQTRTESQARTQTGLKLGLPWSAEGGWNLSIFGSGNANSGS
jgi:hypothetical protein